jgi:hydrogenase expression/formation protein HypE
LNQESDFNIQCPLPSQADTIRLAHGGGGRLMQSLIQDVFLKAFSNSILSQLHDSAVVPIEGHRIAVTTDSYVVRPLFFPGGDIGSMAVHGTINDLAMSGATPLYLTAGFILEEGLPIETLQRVVISMADAAQKAGVSIVCGDTKVVDRGKGDQIFINTTGVGQVPEGIDIGPHQIEPGDHILVSGDLGSHGIAVMSVREGLTFGSDVVSDSAPLHQVVADLLQQGVSIHCMRDLTRGGLASALNELAESSTRKFMIDESKVPIQEPVRGACEVLGLDPLYVANEGRFVLFVPANEQEKALSILRKHTVSELATDIGEVPSSSLPQSPPVTLKTVVGTHRILDLLSGEQLPRIC